MKVKIHEAYRYAVNMRTLRQDTKQFFLENFGCSRKIYNLYVDYLYEQLEKTGYTGGTELPKVKLPEVSSFKKEYPYMKRVDSLGLANAKMDFDNSIKKFNDSHDYTSYTKRARRRAESGTETLSFRGLSGMPKFHAKSRGYFSYTTNCQYPGEGNKLKQPTIRLEGKHLHLPKVKGDIELIIHRKLPEDASIKNVTVSMDRTGSFFVSIGCERTTDMDIGILEAAVNRDQETIDRLRFLGLDYSQPHFYVDSEGRTANYPKFYRESEEKLARYQKQLSKMEKDSHHYQKKLKQIRKLHKHIADQRKDFLHKLSRKLVNQYDVIVVEDINLRAMGQCLTLGKNLHDNGFGMFRDLLAYKVKKKGSGLIKTDRWYASTRTCRVCGEKNPEVVLGVTEWVCPNCGTHHLRDENAAVNIREEGRRIFSDFVIQWLEKEKKTREKAENLSAARKKKRSAA
jgi:putative transposase